MDQCNWFNPEIEKIGDIALVFYIGTGFLFGITTLMDEGTELALGMHAVNNIFGGRFGNYRLDGVSNGCYVHRCLRTFSGVGDVLSSF